MKSVKYEQLSDAVLAPQPNRIQQGVHSASAVNGWRYVLYALLIAIVAYTLYLSTMWHVVNIVLPSAAIWVIVVLADILFTSGFALRVLENRTEARRIDTVSIHDEEQDRRMSEMGQSFVSLSAQIKMMETEIDRLSLTVDNLMSRLDNQRDTSDNFVSPWPDNVREAAVAMAGLLDHAVENPKVLTRDWLNDKGIVRPSVWPEAMRLLVEIGAIQRDGNKTHVLMPASRALRMLRGF